MKKIGLSTAMLMIVMSHGQAMAMEYEWTGLYAGANSGVAFNDSNYNLYPKGCLLSGSCGDPALNPLRTDTDNFHSTDFTGGAQVGYNYQVGKSIVMGLETDFNYISVNDTNSVNRALTAPLVGNFTHHITQTFHWYGTVRPRLGLLTSTGMLIYATGGFAYGRVSSNTAMFTAGGDAYAGSSTTTQTGWAAGAGLEYAFDCNWTAKLEYLYINLGRFNYTNYGNAFAQSAGALYGTQITTRDNLLRLGINYKFMVI